MNQLYSALVSIGEDNVQKLEAHPVAGKLINGSATLTEYTMYLIQVVHQVRASGPMLHRAAEEFQRGGKPGLAALFERKSAEEDGHDLWALQDLAGLGVGEEVVNAHPMSSAVRAYLGWLTFSAERRPVGVLGLAWTLEWFGYARASRAADNLVKHSKLRNVAGCVKFLRGHGDADPQHIQALRAAVDEIDDTTDMDFIALSAQVTAALYLGFFDEVRAGFGSVQAAAQ